MSPGDKVKVRYTDAIGTKLIWKGVLKEQVDDKWRVDVGGVAIVFAADDIEVTHAEQGRDAQIQGGKTA